VIPPTSTPATVVPQSAKASHAGRPLIASRSLRDSAGSSGTKETEAMLSHYQSIPSDSANTDSGHQVSAKQQLRNKFAAFVGKADVRKRNNRCMCHCRLNTDWFSTFAKP
jgi:hypothetical protein